jgi:alkylation response protein AidB-like acyl-CoA dehydrogenase
MYSFRRNGIWRRSLPHTVDAAMSEFISAANMALGMYPGLSKGAHRALSIHGSDAQRRKYLPGFASGEYRHDELTDRNAAPIWPDPHQAPRRRRTAAKKISGSKIFIRASTICEEHRAPVLARIEGAPEGVKGISCS